MEDILGSKMPADNSYGRNGYQGSSSDTPGKRTTSGVLPQVVIPDDPWQTRKLSAEQLVPTTFGHRNRSAGPAAQVPSRPK
jgi:hypothetical protein